MKTLILGGGYAGLAFVRTYAALSSGEQVELVDKYPYHTIKTRLHRVASGALMPDDVTIPFSQFPIDAFHQGEVIDVDPSRQTVDLQDGSRLSYDRLIIALGSGPRFFDIPGLKEHALTLNTLEQATAIRESIETLRFGPVIIGGAGLTGLELASQLIRFEHLQPIYILEALDDIQKEYSPQTREWIKHTLAQQGIRLKLNTPVTEAGPDRVHLANGTAIPYQLLVWTGGIKPVLSSDLDELEGHDNIHLAGDLNLDKPPTAQLAITDGESLARQLVSLDHDHASRQPRQFKSKGMLADLNTTGFGRVSNIELTGQLPLLLKEANELAYTYGLLGLSNWLRSPVK